MGVLLAHSFFLKNDPKQSEKMRPYPPLGTLYAASFLREKGYKIALFDAMLAGGIHEFEAALEAAGPRFLIVYEDQFNFLNKMCLLHSRAAACHMARLGRERGCTVIAAGSDVSDHPEIYLRHGADFGIVGESEHALSELLDALSSLHSAPLDSIAGLAVPDDTCPGGVRRNMARNPERRPDVFPFPAWDLLDTERYRQAWLHAHGYFSVNMVSTRGCPFHCNWCAKPIWGQRYAMRSPANVAEEMALIKATIRPDHIWFADDIFGLQPKWVVEFAAEVKARNASVPFMIQSRADLLTDKAVQALAQAGCTEVWMGAESGSQKILDAMDKGIRVEQVIGARERLRAAGIQAAYFVQFGYPGETFDDILATAALIRETQPDEIGVSVSNPLPGTKFYRMVGAQLGEKDHWQDSNDLAMMFEGTYTTPFYRMLYQLVHRELELMSRSAPKEDLEEVGRQWIELGQVESSYRSSSPTFVQKYYPSVSAPDLSRRWN
ncbi:MAG: radical SAM protein [Bryobacteraceae bacterium]|jgi:anaerobic magnesium-protoporphyrin IX monomethyl ester cyclase